MTLPDSLLDQFGKKGGYRKIELQLDNGNSTAGRHSAPMTRGSLYPLGFASVPLDEWMESTWLRDEDIATAWKLSAFLNTQATNGRDKVTLMLPRAWQGVGTLDETGFRGEPWEAQRFRNQSRHRREGEARELPCLPKIPRRTAVFWREREGRAR